MVTERTIINFLIIGASLILVPFVVSSTLTVDYAPVFFFGGLLALVLAFFFLKEKLSICPLLGGAVAGSANFLPLPLQAQHIACILLILYYITGYVLIRQNRIKLGKTKILWPILVITLIILYHNHNLHVHALGGNTEGAKPAIFTFLVVLAYFCGINVPTPSVDFLGKVPLWYLIMSALSSVPFFLSTYIPSLAPLLYSVTNSVNVEAYVNTLDIAGSQQTTGFSRLGAFSAVGAALQLYLLCHYPIGSWLRPERWWVAGLSLVCVMLTVAGGYRSGFFDFFFLTMTGACCYYSWRALFLPAILFIGGSIILVASSNHVIPLPTKYLPIIAQRTLSFLPGDWDPEALEAAKSSNEFRKSIIDVYIKEYMAKSPLIGNGFDINTKEFDNFNDSMKMGVGDPTYLQAKTFIEGKMFHTGWVSVYDCVGLIGSLAFVALGLNAIGMAAHFVFGPKADRRSSLFPCYVWLFCQLVTLMVSYFTVFGSFNDTFQGLCIYAIVLSHLSDIENTTEVPLSLLEHKGQLEFTGSKGAVYGYQSRL